MPNTAAQQAEDPYTVEGWPLGINNLLPDYSLPKEALRDGINIDIFDSGKIQLRKGSTKKVSLIGAHSFWSDPKNPRPDISYYVAGTTLYSLKVVSGVLTSAAIATGLSAGRKVAYLFLNGDVFWSNGVISGRIHNGVNGPWGLETPANLPILTANVAGSLFPGVYQVALTYRNALGEESGTGPAQTINVPAGGSIVLTGMPIPINTQITQICVYCTPANGEALHKVAVIPSNSSTYTISTLANATTILRTQFLQPMPAGDRIAHLNGIIFVASGSVVYFSEPLRYGLCNLNENFYSYPQDVDEILAVPDEAGLRPQEGLYVCADRTYFLLRAGVPEVEQKITLPFGAIRGTGTYMLNSPNVIWFSPRGQVTGGLAGHAKVDTEAQYMPGVMSHGTSIIREQSGLKQIINTVNQSDISPVEFTGVA
jgi:hypothetical protein